MNTINRNGICYADINLMQFEWRLFFEKHGFPKDFSNHKNRKYLYIFPLIKNGKFSANFTLCSANNINEIFDYVDYKLSNECNCLKYYKESGIECFPKYETSSYKRGYRLGNTVWIKENYDYIK